MKQLLQKSIPKKTWNGPNIVIINQDTIEKNTLANHEVHNGKGSQITVGGNATVAPSFYNKASSHS